MGWLRVHLPSGPEQLREYWDTHLELPVGSQTPDGYEYLYSTLRDIGESIEHLQWPRTLSSKVEEKASRPAIEFDRTPVSQEVWVFRRRP